VNIVVVAVDRSANRDHGLECGRFQRRDLQAIEAAPGDSHHAQVTVAPGLLRYPFDDFAAISQFAR
jgi:hypothetical protein